MAIKPVTAIPTGQWPTLANPYIPTTSSVSGTFSTGNFNGVYPTGTGPYTIFNGSAMVSGIATPPPQEQPVVEKLPPIKNIRAIDEPFIPSCEQT